MLGLNPLDNWTPFSTWLFCVVFIIVFVGGYYLINLPQRKPKMNCRMCGKTGQPMAILYETDGLCRKCFDEIILLAMNEKPNYYPIKE